MAGSILTLYLNNPQQSSSSAGLLTPTQPGASTSTTGWTPGKTSVSFPFSLLSYNVERNQWNSGVRPNNPPCVDAGHFAQDCWRLSATTTGDFSAGTWYSSISVIAVTAGGAQDGRARFRIWRSSSASGAGAVEITKGSSTLNMIGTTVTNLSTTVAQSSSASTQVAAFSLSDEYLFLQMAWEITGAGSANGQDVLIRLGSLSQVDGSGLVTPTFTITGGAASVSGGMLMSHYYSQIAQDC